MIHFNLKRCNKTLLTNKKVLTVAFLIVSGHDVMEISQIVITDTAALFGGIRIMKNTTYVNFS